jgi:outer membrane protein assembly factor BamB
MLLLRYGVPVINPDWFVYGLLGAVACSLLIVLWWLFFSRALWFDRIAAIVLMAIAIFVTSRLVDKSIAGGGMGMLFYILSIPLVALALVVWAVATNRLSLGTRRITMVATIFLAAGVWLLFRTGGLSSAGDSDFAWRWSETPEDRLLARSDKPRAGSTAQPENITNADWPGFRGPNRDSIIHGVSIQTNWSASPPVELWRRPIGPGWSSFAAREGYFYTQEQRGDDEVVACYKLTTGEPVWTHTDKARFWESNGGAGPRGTPTISNGRVYSLGGTGILNALNANDGSRVWSRNAASETKTKVPIWGFSSSPLVVDDIVVVAVSGALVAYDASNGNPRWTGPVGAESYSSPHLMTINGVSQVLVLSGQGLSSVSPSDGKLLWKHDWKGYPIVQPALTADGDVLISVSDSGGTRRLAVTHDTAGWSAKERYTSIGLKPYFTDFVVHKGYAYGFDGRYVACMDVKDGTKKWKGGKFGNGQLVLIADQDLLLILSEKGELALVKAVPQQFTEVARFQAIKGKTWNHPVLVGNIVLVRNAQEMAAFKLATR